MPKATKQTAKDFIVNCLNQLEAGGYQEFEGDNSEVPDGITPDEISHDGNVIVLKFGDRVFHVTVSIPRQK